MSALHDVLHGLVNSIAYPSEGHRDAAHAEIDTIPDYAEQPNDEQLDAEQPVDEQLVAEQTKENKG